MYVRPVTAPELTMATARRKAKRRVAPKPKGLPIPRGFHTVTPSLAVVGGVAALEFYKKAFGAKELQRQVTPSGQLIHGRLRIGDSIVMLSDVFRGSDRSAPSTVETTTVTLHIYTTDVESLWNRAVDAGAKVTMPLDDMFWGERYGHLVDPFGHHWSLSTPIRMSKSVREAKRKESMRAFTKGEDPDKVPSFTDI
jgi:PhnB protein